MSLHDEKKYETKINSEEFGCDFSSRKSAMPNPWKTSFSKLKKTWNNLQISCYDMSEMSWKILFSFDKKKSPLHLKMYKIQQNFGVIKKHQNRSSISKLLRTKEENKKKQNRKQTSCDKKQTFIMWLLLQNKSSFLKKKNRNGLMTPKTWYQATYSMIKSYVNVAWNFTFFPKIP